MNNDELIHYGVKGQRWGVRRFQNRDGSLTAAGKKRVAGNSTEDRSRFSIFKKKQATPAKKTSGAKGEQAEKDKKDPKAEYEERKQKAVKSGSAQEVLAFKGDLSPQEMRSAIERIRWEQDMKAISDKDAAAGREKADKFFKDVDRATDYAVTTAKAYNTFANVYNAFSKTDKKLLPTIDLDNTKPNRDKRKAEEKERKQAEKAEKAAEKREKQEDRAEKKAAKEQTEKRQNQESSADDKHVHVYNIIDYGKQQSSSTRKKAERVVYDAEWEDVTVNSAPASDRALGQRYVAGLLEDKYK